MHKLFTPEEIELIRHFPFAQVICVNDGQLNCSASPVLYQPETGHFSLHLSKSNPVANATLYTDKISIIFQAQEQYISPLWHPQQLVPTWNYAQLQLDCCFEIINDLEQKRNMLNNLTAEHEDQWSLDGAQLSPKQVQQMLNAIQVYLLRPRKLTSRFKLSQNKPLECRQVFADKMQQQNKALLASWQLSPPKEHRSLLCN